MTDILALKRAQLEQVAAVRRSLWREPDLSWLFFELTTRCNLHCAHCGSSCRTGGIFLEPEMIAKALRDADPSRVMIALTGGEPMLHPSFDEIGRMIADRGFHWGMTTNATLIGDTAAQKLREAGMSTVSVSLDGLRDSHDRLRGREGAFDAALNGIRALKRAGFDPQITTVVYPANIGELEELEKLLFRESVTSWRIINVEPIGRARENLQLMLSPDQFRQMLDFIQDRHLNSRMDVSFGCSHYVGPERERMVRPHYFFCGAGITVASVRANGDICACLDIENRPELVQGNIHTDDFGSVWRERFGFFRTDRTEISVRCRDCPDRIVCGGDSTHTWDFGRNEPFLCVHDWEKGDEHDAGALPD